MEQFKGTKEVWYDTFTLGKERGVRSKGGFICMLTKPTHYSGQDERYEKELEENKANAKLIAAAPDLLEALHDLLVHAVENDLHSEFTNNAEIAIKKALK